MRFESPSGNGSNWCPDDVKRTARGGINNTTGSITRVSCDTDPVPYASCSLRLWIRDLEDILSAIMSEEVGGRLDGGDRSWTAAETASTAQITGLKHLTRASQMLKGVLFLKVPLISL